jgi:hypothetical protein
MAVEAQLCPQCGANVTFVDLQTEAVCPYCGTTVSHAQAAAAVVRPVNNVDELSAEDKTRLKQLALDGRRPDALNFVLRRTGLSPEHAAAAVDAIAAEWQDSHLQPGLFEPKPWAALIWLAMLVVDVAALLLFRVVYRGGSLSGTDEAALPGMLIIGMIIVTLIWIGATLRAAWLLRNSVRLRTGKAAPGVLKKIVGLKPETEAAGARLITRLELEVPILHAPPQIVERALTLPRETQEALRPGAKIEVITNGLDFIYITVPIKVVG